MRLTPDEGTWDSGLFNQHNEPAENLLLRNYTAHAYTPCHPLARHYAATDDHAPVTIKDIMGDAAWQRCSLSYDMPDDLRLVRQLAIPLPAPLRTQRLVLIGRSGADFGDHDRAFTRRLQPLLGRLDKHLHELQRYRHSLSAHGASGRPEERAAECGITPRELTVLGLLAESLTAAAIARRLGITPRTVNTHLENLYRKLGTRDRLTTVLLAQELHLLTPRGH